MHLRRFAPLVAALALGVVALPSEARAEQFCYGKITPIAATPERDTGVTYEFTCREPVKAFNVATTTKLSAFDVSADVFDPESGGGAIRADDRFGECEGGIPSYGFSCAGVNSGFSRFTRATFDTENDPCAKDSTKHIALKASIVVANLNGKLSGPFVLGKPQGCPKPVKAKKKAKSKV